MSGVAALVRVSTTVETRLSFSSSSSRRCHYRRPVSSSCVDSRARRDGEWRPRLIHHARDASSQSTPWSLRTHLGEPRLVRALSSTTFFPCSSKSINGDSARSTDTYGEDATADAETSTYKPMATNEQADTAYSFPTPESVSSAKPAIAFEGLVIDDASQIRPSKDLDYRRLLGLWLHQRKPANVLTAILAASEDEDCIRDIPNTTFSEIIRLIQPNKIIRGDSVVRNKYTPHMVKQMKITPPDAVVDAYLHAVLKIVAARKAAGRSLDVTDYANLLRIAYKARSKTAAEAFWQAMQADNVLPDVRCFNHYLGAIVHNSGNYCKDMYRVTDFHRKARSLGRRGSDYAAYKFGEGGIREETLSLLDEMLKRELVPDVETFRLIILGVAREGDISMVQGILKNVWGVDVPALMGNADETQLLPRNEILQSSMLYPDGALLHAIAQAFGINNDISMALRTVDYISRTFKVDISRIVWEELFEWTFVLAMPRYGQQRFTTGQVPKDSVLKLWTTMTNKPYNIEPTMAMYDKLIKMLSELWRPKDMWYFIQEALQLYKRHNITAGRSYRRLEKAIMLTEHSSSSSPISMEKSRSKFLTSEMLRKQNRALIKRWLQLLLGTSRTGHKIDVDQSWSTISIPMILERMSAHAPRIVRYDIPAGIVEIVFRRRGEMDHSHSRALAMNERKEAMINFLPVLPGTRVVLGKDSFRSIGRGKAAQPST